MNPLIKIEFQFVKILFVDNNLGKRCAREAGIVIWMFKDKQVRLGL